MGLTLLNLCKVPIPINRKKQCLSSLPKGLIEHNVVHIYLKLNFICHSVYQVFIQLTDTFFTAYASAETIIYNFQTFANYITA